MAQNINYISSGYTHPQKQILPEKLEVNINKSNRAPVIVDQRKGFWNRQTSSIAKNQSITTASAQAQTFDSQTFPDKSLGRKSGGVFAASVNQTNQPTARRQLSQPVQPTSNQAIKTSIPYQGRTLTVRENLPKTSFKAPNYFEVQHNRPISDQFDTRQSRLTREQMMISHQNSVQMQQRNSQQFEMTSLPPSNIYPSSNQPQVSVAWNGQLPKS